MSTLTALRAGERRALVDTLRAVGPDAPTLCAAWRSADIAGHLVVSEAALGMPMVVANALRRVLPASVTRRTIASLRSQGDRLILRARSRGWDLVISKLASGPPTLYRFGALAHVRLIEEWVHHEDIRRANGLTVRPDADGLDDALWHAGLTLASYREFLPGREHLALVLPDGRREELGRETQVEITGRPGEILLYVAGRTDAADVVVSGDADAIASLIPRLAV
jgi:uncharacterized protein (TIGR03085 family)